MAATAAAASGLRHVVRSLLLCEEGAPETVPDALADLRQRLDGTGAPGGGQGPPAEGGQAAILRAALCVALEDELREASAPSSSSAAAAKELPTRCLAPAAFDAMVGLFTAALDGCGKDGDPWNGRNLLELSRALLSRTQEGRATNVLLKIYNHPLWSRVTFWEDNVIIIIIIIVIIIIMIISLMIK